MNHRIIKAGKTSRITKSNCRQHPPTMPVSLSAASLHFFNTPRNGDFPPSLGSLCQCLTALLEKKLLLTSNLNLPWCNIKSLALVLLTSSAAELYYSPQHSNNQVTII